MRPCIVPALLFLFLFLATSPTFGNELLGRGEFRCVSSTDNPPRGVDVTLGVCNTETAPEVLFSNYWEPCLIEAGPCPEFDIEVVASHGDSGFEEFVAELTDGEPDTICMSGLSRCDAFPESTLFELNATDLAGFRIEQVVLTVDTFMTLSFWRDDLNERWWHTWLYCTLSVYGEPLVALDQSSWWKVKALYSR